MALTYIIYQQFIAMYNSGCQIYCNWSRLKLVFKVPVHQSTMLQINMQLKNYIKSIYSLVQIET